MTTYTIQDNILHLTVEGADKIWALKSKLNIPLDHISEVRIDEEVVNKWWHGLKIAGISIPHVITAGTFYQDHKRIFWDIHHPKQAVVISLNSETYNELVIEVANPEIFVNYIHDAKKY